MQTIPLEMAQSHLADLIDGLPPGEEVLLTRFGTMKGSILYLAPDFDDIPDGFED